MAKIVLIEWVDSQISPLWESKDTIIELSQCMTAGFLIREDKYKVELALNLSGDTKSCVIVIPKESIRTWRELWQ